MQSSEIHKCSWGRRKNRREEVNLTRLDHTGLNKTNVSSGGNYVRRQTIENVEHILMESDQYKEEREWFVIRFRKTAGI